MFHMEIPCIFIGKQTHFFSISNKILNSEIRALKLQLLLTEILQMLVSILFSHGTTN